MFCIQTVAANTIGSWKTYLAYSNVSDVQTAGDMVYVLASGNLFSYNQSDESLQTYDKTTVLSDCGIRRIAWCKAAKRLIIIYDNYNIDLLDANGNVTNVSDYYYKSTTDDKTINNICIDGNYAYLSTGFGIVKLNVGRAEISDTYNLGRNVNATALADNCIFAATNGSLMRARTTDNLLDKRSWTSISRDNYSHLFNFNGKLVGLISGGAFTIDTQTGEGTKFFFPYFDKISYNDGQIVCYGFDYTYIIASLTDLYFFNRKYDCIVYDGVKRQYWCNNDDGNLQRVEFDSDFKPTVILPAVKPDGPKHNTFGYLKFYNNSLYSCSGGFGKASEMMRPGCVQVLNGDQWSFYEEGLEDKTGHAYQDLIALDVDPTDNSHVFAGGKTGLYEFKEGRFLQHFNCNDGSVLGSAVVPESPNYVLVEAVKFDPDGNLWLLNSQSLTASLIEYTKEGKWVTHDFNSLYNQQKRSQAALQNIFFDSRGLMWFVNNSSITPALYCYNPQSNELTIYDKFVNEDGTTVLVYYVRCVSEDLDGNIWIGTNTGPLILYPSEFANGRDATFEQVKVPRNDDTNLADYLLNGVDISCMAIDASGRKWFGTMNNGVYLISTDNIVEEKHFLENNSNLLSNNIESIAIDSTSGEVFIGTDKGLCSYMSDATDVSEKMTKDNVYAYPNPVRPDYNGPITITGLTLNAYVKIVTANGVLVNEGRSNGGLYTWDGNDKKGHRVASGVYMVQTATQDGKKGTVCKIAIIN